MLRAWRKKRRLHAWSLQRFEKHRWNPAVLGSGGVVQSNASASIRVRHTKISGDDFLSASFIEVNCAGCDLLGASFKSQLRGAVMLWAEASEGDPSAFATDFSDT